MATKKKDILEQAVADATKVREAAVENAKDMIMKAFTPKIKAIMSTAITEDENQPAGYDPEGEQERIDGADDPAEKGDGPAIIEQDEEEEMDMDVEEEPVEDEMVDLEDEDEELEECGDAYGEDDEEIDLDLDDDGGEEEMEMDLDDGEEVDELEIGEDDMEDDFDEDEDTIEVIDDEEEEIEGDEMDEEDLFEVVTQALKENKKLKAELRKYRGVMKNLKEEFEAVNLFNAKLVFANKMLHRGGMTKNQKIKMLETFDAANTIREVKIIYKTISESAGTPKQTKTKRMQNEVVKSVEGSKLNESTAGNEDDYTGRMQELAGIDGQ